MRLTRHQAGVAVLIALAHAAQATPVAGLLPDPVAPAPALMGLVRLAAPVVALIHARIIDGLGGPAQDGRTIVLDHAHIASILPDGAPTPAGAQVIDATGETVLPGLVGLHNHLYYVARPNLSAQGFDDPLLVPEMPFSSLRLYLAGGVTTMRTTGSVETYTDLNLKHAVDAGRLAGPHMDITGPYLEGNGSRFIQMYPLRDAQDARQTVAYWADRGVTSFKAYMNITRAELGAAIAEAHRRGLKVTGHLCSVTYPEAAALGIDDLEHGFTCDTENDPDHAPDQCSKMGGIPTMMSMAPDSPQAAALIHTLVADHVAITSTLPVFEGFFRPSTAPLPPSMLAALTTQARAALSLSLAHKRPMPPEKMVAMLTRAMALERAFVAAGGLLVAGPDPTGAGNVVPGFGDEREVELLVEAGFSPGEAVRIATYNGAIYLGVADRIGSVQVGRDADLMVVRGDPSTRIADIENVDVVFKDGVGWDSAKLRASVKGDYGQY